MKSYLTIILLVGFVLIGKSQSDKVTVKVDTKSDNNYIVSICNKTDSVLCILSSPNFYYFGDVPTLALYNKRGENNIFNIISTLDSSYIDSRLYPYLSICVFPRQTIVLNFTLPEIFENKILSIDFMFKENYCHQKFIKEIKKRGWYNKYKFNVIETLF